MGVIDSFRKASTLVLGGRTSAQSYQDSAVAMIREGMNTSANLGPGAPIQPTYPADGIAQPPRSYDYQTGYNISARPRTHERISFWTLKGIIDSYDIAQLCITHRIDSLRSSDWSIVPDDGATGDLTAEIQFAKKFFSKPDGRTPFKAWLGKYLWDVLAYDAGTLYRARNNAGNFIGLKVVDGLTIAPLIDELGDTPTGDAPAFTQYVHGNVWKWLMDEDIIYVPYRPQPDSMYGRSPIESVLLTANTDLRLQAYFMQQFTDGNVPAGFGISPEGWGPEQIKDYQAAWDAILVGDQSARQRIRWVPAGSSFDFLNNQTFDKIGELPKLLMTKVAAAYHVTPADLGFTETVNKSSGESQAAVQNRVGDLPLKQHLQDIFSAVLQDDLGLPLRFEFENGKLEEDRLQTAQSDQVYMDSGVISASWVAEARFGIIDPPGEIVPRYFKTKNGPVAVSTLMAASTAIDPETGNPVTGTTVAAIQSAIIPVGSDSAAPGVAAVATDAPVAKEVEALGTEFRAFGRFQKSRRKLGVWRDFQFVEADRVTAHRLNTAGFVSVRKDRGELTTAGLAVVAQSTGRVLMLQRGVSESDGGVWEFPGGHMEPGEAPIDAAYREWCEEVGQALPQGNVTADWVSPNGVYCGFVMVVPDESCCLPHDRSGGLLNPDDPDGDATEAVAWWYPNQLVSNSAVRAELAADISIVLGAINDALNHVPVDVGDGVMKDAALVRYTERNGVGSLRELAHVHGTEDEPDPKVRKGWRDSKPRTPQMRYDLALTDQYTPQIQAALVSYVQSFNLQAVIDRVVVKDDTPDGPGRDVMTAAARAEAETEGLTLDGLKGVISTMYADGWAAGENSAAEQLSAHLISVDGLSQAVIDVNWSDWHAGDPLAADAINSEGLTALLDTADVTIKGIEDTTIDMIGGRLADGLAAGDSISSMAGDILDLVGSDSTRAEMIAHTESTRAVMSATFDVFGQNGVGQWELVTSDGACALCLSVENGNPWPTSDMSNAPPLHPWCRCSAAPVPSSIVGDNITTATSEE
jgi:SPP1 gp7 family putative phage head morphogenesis protein